MAAAVPAAVTFLVLDVPGGFQFRKAVQILHGFPSGPMTIPGGRGSLFEVSGVGGFGLPMVVVCAEQSTLPTGFHALAVIENGDAITVQGILSDCDLLRVRQGIYGGGGACTCPEYYPA